jgi:hypothetical protein
MWDLTVIQDHDFYIGASSTAVLTHNCPTSGGEENDPAASRVYLRKSTKFAIQQAAEKTPEGDYVDPNTGDVIPETGPYHIGHAYGFERWRTQQIARAEGWTCRRLDARAADRI